MRNENRNNEQCRNEKGQSNLEFAKEFSLKKQLLSDKKCGGGCGK